MKSWSREGKSYLPGRGFCRFGALLMISLIAVLSASGDPWWSQEKTEEIRKIEEGINYQRILYKKITSEPVRAHILSVTGVGDRYIYGVLGSFGALFPSTEYAKQSEALAVINGSYFSKKPTRGIGLIAAHNRILYQPSGNSQLYSTVGFTPTEVLFDWIGPEDIRGAHFQSDKSGWNDCHAALGAGPMMIHQGHSRVETDLEGFNKDQLAPRTAIGKTADGQILMVVVDGRQPDWSAGVTLVELTELFLAYHAIDALNLDGGGSSTLVIQNQIINRPSDFAIPGQPGKERPVANVIAVFKK